MSNFLDDGRGNSLSMRLGFLAWVIGVLVVWVYICIVNKNISDLPAGIVGVLGIAFAGKTVSGHVETNAPDAPKP